VEDVPADGRGVGTRRSLRSLPTLTVLWFYELKADTLSSHGGVQPFSSPWEKEETFHPKALMGKSRQNFHGALAGFLVKRGWVSLWFLETSPELKNRGEEKRQDKGTMQRSSTSVFPELNYGFRENWDPTGLITSSKGEWQASLSLLKFPSLGRAWVNRHHL